MTVCVHVGSCAVPAAVVIPVVTCMGAVLEGVCLLAWGTGMNATACPVGSVSWCLRTPWRADVCVCVCVSSLHAHVLWDV